jgi:5-hydroxyisourate hydrolase
MSTVTTHVLDTSVGRPARGVAVTLERLRGGGWTRIATGRTDADGRILDLGRERLTEGEYRLVFETGAYFAARGVVSFHPEVTVVFRVEEEGGHYHVPLLLAPFAYSTYRGS